MRILLKRVYDPPAPQDGARYLVDRLWPRGLSKTALALTGWLKDLAPSHELRRWFGHDPARWEVFRQRYWRELEQNPRIEDLVRELAQHPCVTLLYAATDPLHNQAVVLREFLASRIGGVPSGADLASGTASAPAREHLSGPGRPGPTRPRSSRQRSARRSRTS